MGEVVRFPKSSTPAGAVFVEPCPEDGGCWAIMHESHDGKSVACIGTRFRFDDAFEDAERFAEESGAFFETGFGGAA